MVFDDRDIESNTTHPGNTDINDPVLPLLPFLSEMFMDVNKIPSRPWTYKCDDDEDDDKRREIKDENNKNEKKNNRMI
jgi:hypothetical protein